tara:strand:- start:641 stop:1111 length:471 start_codon:yes stop_codon:yes gene_type:complete
VDEKKLLKYAIDYLSKYDSSKKNLTNVLKRKIFRLTINNSEKAIFLKDIEKIILKLQSNNLISDKRYCSNKISYLSRIGKSKKYICSYLIKKGIDKIEVQNNLDIFNNENNNWELKSARLFAKKKNFINSNESYEKKLSKMARAGFSYEICKKILG